MTEVATKSTDASRRLACVCTIGLLAAIAFERFAFSRPVANAAAYHEEVRNAAAGFPFHFDRWLGVDVPVPQGAISLLKPNVLISRRYEEMGQGRTASFILVQCTDARDLLGHYPPVCYVNQGWLLKSSSPREWIVDGQVIAGTRYCFAGTRDGLAREVEVDNFLVTPNGCIARSMDEVDAVARTTQLKYFGAGQVQVAYESNLSESDRDEILSTFVRQAMPIIKAILKPTKEVK